MISLRKHSNDISTPHLRIVVPTPLYGGSLPIAYHAADAFGDLGHHCVLLKYDEQYELFETLGSEVADAAGRMLKSRFAELLAEYTVERSLRAQADLVWYTAQSPVSIRSLQRLREAGIKTALWFVEDVRRFEYWRHIVSEFDVVFTIQVGESAHALQEAGARKVVYLPCAANVKVHRPLILAGDKMRTYGSTVSFVGAGYPNRVTLFSGLNLPGLKLWGNDWPTNWSTRLEESGRRITTEETAFIYNSTDINLNIHSAIAGSVLQCGDFVNPRTFEIAACGGFQIVNRQAPLDGLFRHSELCVVDNIDQLREAIAYYSGKPAERKQLAEASRERVLKEHTYLHRMKEALDYVIHEPVAARTAVPAATFADLKVAAHGDHEMQEFLAQFSDSEPASLQKLVERVSNDRHPLSRAELIVLLMHEFRNWGVEKGVIK